jgi:hypothetical protein
MKQPNEWKKLFTNCSTDKGLISGTHKELKKLTAKEQII